MGLPSGIVAFLFTDVEGSSSRWDAATEAMADAIRTHDSIIRGAVGDHRGVVVKSMGDGVMAAFADPVDAVTAALAMQDAIGEADWPKPVQPFRVRMGIHAGPAEVVDGDYLGPTVNRAARIEAAAHGGQVLVSGAIRELVAGRVSAPVRDLGQHHLRGLDRPERLAQVGLGEFPPLQTESTPTNLPAAVQDLVGRDGELERLLEAIDDTRLVTIVGPGGAGKTALALEAARRRAAAHPSGVWLLPLAPISDGGVIAGELLGAMRRPAPAVTSPEDALLDALRHEQSLLVLDNVEHLVADVAHLAAAVLATAPGVSLLVTSREPLDVAGERVWPIPTLGLPEGDDPEEVLASDSGRLFAMRAAAARPGFEIDAENAATVADLCRRLDGLPLALELAAARLRSMGLADIGARLADRFSLLRSHARDAMPHHRALWDTVEWSYELLDVDTRRTYRRLSTFVGGFDLTAAEAVAEGTDVLGALDELVAQSMLSVSDGDPPRYSMLETIRQHGAAKLDDSGEAEAAAQAHFDWVAALVREGGRALEGRDQRRWLRRFRTEIDNLREALAWSLANDPVAGAGMVAGLSRWFWMYAAEGDTTMMRDSTSYLREGYEWATKLLAAAGDDLPDKLRARLQLAIGGLLCVRTGRFEEALERLAEAEAVFEAEGDTRNLGWATFYRGTAGVGIVSREETVATVAAASALHDEAGDPFGSTVGRLMTGLYRFEADYEAALSDLLWVEAAAERTGIPALMAHANDALGQYSVMMAGPTQEARERFVDALETFRGLHNYACLCHTLHGAASVFAAQGRIEDAARTYGITDGIRKRLSMVVAPYEQRDWVLEGLIGQRFGDEDWERARTEGRTFEPDEGIDWVIAKLQPDRD